MWKQTVNIVVTAVDQASKTLSWIWGKFSWLASQVASASKVVGAFALWIWAMWLKIAWDFEQTRVSFETMLWSADKAKILLKELSDFAASTPFEFPEIAKAGKSLLAFWFASQDIQKNLTMLWDIASGLNIPFWELSDIYWKIRVQWRLYQEDINQLTGRGIPIIKELAKQFWVNESEVKKLVEAWKIWFPEIERAFKDLTKEWSQFGWMMEKQSKTLNWQLSTLQDNFKGSLMQIIGINKEWDIKWWSIFEKITKAVWELNKRLETDWPKIQENIESVLKVLEWWIWIVKTSIEWWYKLWGALWWVAAQTTIKWWEITKKFNNTLVTVLTDLKKSEWEIWPVAQKWWLNLVTMMADWMKEEVIEAKSKWIAWIIADYLWFHSPTEKWPASDSDKWMPNLIKMLSDWLYKWYTDIDRAAAKIATSLSWQLWKWVNLEQIKERLSLVKEQFITTFEKINDWVEEHKDKIINLWDEYKDLKKKLADINKTISWLKDEWRVDVAKRAVDIETEIKDILSENDSKQNDINELKNDLYDTTKDITEEEKKNIDKKITQINLEKQKNNEKVTQLQIELQIAKSNTSQIEIDKARIELSKTETQKILDRMNLKIQEANVEKQETINLMNEKKANAEREYILYQDLITKKKSLDESYFSIFQSKVRQQNDDIQSNINKLNSMIGVSNQNQSNNTNNWNSTNIDNWNKQNNQISLYQQYLDEFIKKWVTNLNKLKEVFNKWMELLSWSSELAFKNAYEQYVKISWAKAVWGSVAWWEAYLVWENWPEIFRPLGAGKIIPNWQIWGWSVNININLWWVVVQKEADENRLVEKIRNVIYQEQRKANLWFI
jgi:tape measure domain-containing protein